MTLSKIQNFSGGEKSRLVLAMLIYQKPNLLLLDEPTNHLDLEMRQALAEALQDFAGAMVIVSHDRHLLSVSCDKLMLVNQQKVCEFDLSLDDYPKWLSDHNASIKNANQVSRTTTENAETNNLSSKERKRLEATQRQKTLPLRKEIQKLEKIMQQTSDKIKVINDKLSDSDIYTDNNKQKLQEALFEKAELDRKHDDAEISWLELNEELEKLV